MSQNERTKLGVYVEEELWQEFREDVEARHGYTRGVLGSEVENALRAYLYGEGAPEVHERLDHINQKIDALLSGAESDGGPVVRDGSAHTHTAERVQSDTTPDGRPHPKASRPEKAEWLAAQFDLSETPSLAAGAVEGMVERHYSFGERATEALVEAVVSELGLVPDPTDAAFYTTPERADAHLDAAEREVADAASEQLDRLDAGERPE